MAKTLKSQEAQILTLDEAAGYLRIPRSTLYKLAQKGRVPAQKVGRHWRFHRASIDRWFQEQQPGPGSPARSDRSSRSAGHRVDSSLLSRDPRLAEMARRLAGAYQPERIYLFGSAARGDLGSDSDYDVLVVVPDAASPERRSSQLAYRALRGTGVATDVLVCTRGYFESRLHLRASLPATVAREGKLLFAA